MTSFADKIAGAPISLGACRAPDWGYQLPPERVPTGIPQAGLASRRLTAVGGLRSGIERLLITSHSVPPPVQR
jgi:inosose dehydratase